MAIKWSGPAVLAKDYDGIIEDASERCDNNTYVLVRALLLIASVIMWVGYGRMQSRG